MKIAICEDNQAERDALRFHVQASLQARGIAAELFLYEDGEALLAAAKKHYFSILFLDILLPGQSGTEVALKLRKGGSNAAIVFTTITDDFLAQSYVVWAVHYLKKPLARAGVDEALSRALTVVQSGMPMLEILAARHTEHIPYADIYYIEGSNRQCVIHTRTGIYAPYTSIKRLLAQLNDPRFVHCHRSYIVNLQHVLGMQQNRFAVQGDALVPIRRGEATAMRRLYEDFRIRLVRGRD